MGPLQSCRGSMLHRLMAGLIMWWIVASACLFTVGNFIDSHSNDGRFRRPIPWRIHRLHFMWFSHFRQLDLALLHTLVHYMHQILHMITAYSLAFGGLSFASWISAFCGVGEHNGVWLVSVGAPYILLTTLGACRRLFQFLFVDVISAIKDMVTQDDLSSLSEDIHQLLQEPLVEWSMDDTLDSTLAISLTTPPPKSRPVHVVDKRIYFSGRHVRWLITCLIGLFCTRSAHGYGFQDIVLEASEGVPNFQIGSPTVSFSPSHPGWRTRRRFRNWSKKTSSHLPDSQQFWVPKSASCKGDAACETTDPTSAFLGSFNPASSGMELLVTERLDRLMHHVSVPSKNTKHTVSINLEQSLNSIISCASKWFFPAADESVFNSIGTGLDAPLVVDSGASCCITPHREDFTSYGTSKVKVKDLSGVNRVAGEGTINWKVLDSYGAEYTIKLKAYHMPGASVRLLSPQSLYTSIKGSDGHQMPPNTPCTSHRLLET